MEPFLSYVDTILECIEHNQLAVYARYMTCMSSILSLRLHTKCMTYIRGFIFRVETPAKCNSHIWGIPISCVPKEV